FLTTITMAALFLASCAIKPPVQEMAEARSALKAAQQLQGQSHKADLQLKSAETALEEASLAIENEHFEKARRKAVSAKHNAQRAAEMKQRAQSSQ
ncbi:MAG: hypothetical protein R8K22_06450, partial [Mariprofundaceae bacterium]